jgi:hypothetical protein
LDVKVVQITGIALKLRVRFENDVILVDLGVQSVDLPLSEGIVESVVQSRGRDAEA